MGLAKSTGRAQVQLPPFAKGGKLASAGGFFAEPLYRQALTIFEKAPEPTHPKVTTCRANYAQLLWQMKRTAEAVALETRANRM